jgi:hypothetical protein
MLGFSLCQGYLFLWQGYFMCAGMHLVHQADTQQPNTSQTRWLSVAALPLAVYPAFGLFLAKLALQLAVSLALPGLTPKFMPPPLATCCQELCACRRSAWAPCL